MIPSYSDYFNTVLRGPRSEPRGLGVHEVFNATLLFRPGEMLGRERINYKLGLMEGLQFIAGIFNKYWIAAVAPKAKLDLFTLQAAYGPRAARQFPMVIQALKADPMSRRATIVLPEWGETGTADMPCTVSLAFSVRDGRLKTTVFMRSSDTVWGLPYDVTQFGMVAQMVARVLDVEVSPACLFIVNGHVYDGTQNLRPNGDGAWFDIAVHPVNWTEAQLWAKHNAMRLAEGLPLEGIVLNGC